MFPLWIFGVIIVIFSIFVKVIGTVIQKISHKKKNGKKYCRNIYWVAGFTLTVSGSFIDLAALALAPQSLIASLGGLTLVVNVLIARMILGEVLKRKQYIATVTILSGTILTVLYAPKLGKDKSIEEVKDIFESVRFLLYIIMAGGVLLTVRYFNWHLGDEYEKTKSILVPISSGMMAAQNMFFGKILMTMVRYSIENTTAEVFKNYIFYMTLGILIFTIIMYTRWLNNALEKHRITLVYPVTKCVWILTSIFAGLFVLQEDFKKAKSENEEGYKDGDEILYGLGIVFIILGLIYYAHLEDVEELSIRDSKTREEESDSLGEVIEEELEVVVGDG